MEPLSILLIAFFATLLSSMSGGGSSIIAIPLFLSMGISFPMATAMQKVSAVFWVLPTGFNYLKGKKIDWIFLTLFAGIGLIGAYVGVLVIVSIPQRILEVAIGILILLLVFYTFFRKELGLHEKEITSRFRKLLAYPFALILGFYESVFGSGNGILFSLVSFYTRGTDFVKALGYYFIIAFAWVTFASILLFTKGYFDLGLFIPATIGSVAGGYIGSKYAQAKGNKFIKLMFLVVGGTLGIKLILGL